MTTTRSVRKPGSDKIFSISAELLQDAEMEATRVQDLTVNIKLLVKPGMTASQLAHLYADARLAYDMLAEVLKPLADHIAIMAKKVIPEQFENEGTTSLTTDTGYRVTTSMNLYASILKDRRDAAHEWLRDHNLGELVIDMVNSSTLSAAARHMLDEGQELPEHLFTTAYVPNTSMTRVKK